MHRIIITFLFFMPGFCPAQTPIDSYKLAIGDNKVSHLIFRYPVKQVTLGSKDITGQIMPSADTILEIKAIRKDFAETNIGVLTADGRLYSFLVTYASSPDPLNLSFGTLSKENLSPRINTPLLLDSKASQIVHQENYLHVKTSQGDIKLKLVSIYYLQHVLWFSFESYNNSVLEYEPDYFHFFIQDKHSSKRTAIQQQEITPIYLKALGQLARGDRKKWIVGFEQFTLRPDQRFICQVAETSGARLLSLSINHKIILKAHEPLP